MKLALVMTPTKKYLRDFSIPMDYMLHDCQIGARIQALQRRHKDSGTAAQRSAAQRSAAIHAMQVPTVLGRRFWGTNHIPSLFSFDVS